ncbi:SDR family oxidoreductase [Derxia gummosa]|uniref:SDR family oxidoreductase n=1 Tax=Derxia gummosa DSM 723 TaxID=1121388 RepID=A0A8B6X2W0_9BURK|nr:SDR family NAD(P)-dependent oxidoreductase [Derxia gummosa]
MKLSDNTILITGATSGIGRALAVALHERGNRVIVAGRRRALLDEIAQAHPGIATLELDVADPASIKAAAERLRAEHPALNVLINNAGIMKFDDAAGALDDAVAEAQIATNLLGPIRLSAALLPLLRGKPGATIVNNTSVLAFVPLAATAVYSATKAALHSYTLSQRFLLRDAGIDVVEIAPPWVDTDLIHKSGDPRAMPLDAFIAQTLAALEAGGPEALVDAVRDFRANPGPGEHALVDGFNAALRESPIPTA